MIILTIFFFITAILYSSIGFGGGSTYLALLLIWDIPYYIFPILALICNIIVVSGNSINFLKSNNINFNLLYPYLIGSIPTAFIGASISIDKNLFENFTFLYFNISWNFFTY
jgi:Sulfite exporter TauE/SafE.